MKFGFSSEQEEFRDVMRRFLAERSPATVTNSSASMHRLSCA